MDDIKRRKILPSDLDFIDNKRLETQRRVFKRWVNSQLKQAENHIEIMEAVDVFRDPKALLSLAQELANRKASTSNFQPSDGISTQQNAISLIERLYGHDVAEAIQLACCAFQQSDTDGSNSVFNRLTLGLDALWILGVAAGSGTGPVENVQACGAAKGSGGSSSSTLIGYRSKISSTSSVISDPEVRSTRSPALDRWLTRQDERLLAWCQDVTQSYEGINISNCTTSWRDGLAFLAIINQQRPELFNYKSRLEKTPMQNLGMAFHLITKEFAVPRLIEAEDLLSTDAVDARSVALYLIELRSAVEMDRRRRNRPSFEIRTTAMENQMEAGFTPEFDGVTVTVANTSSRSSSPTSSVLTLYSEDTSDRDDTSHLEESQLNFLEFQRRIERSLAWILSMEEHLVENFPQLKELIERAGKEKKYPEFQDIAAVNEKENLEAIEKLPIEDVKPLNEAIVERLSDTRTRFNAHVDLTARLTKRELNVCQCLRYGQQLASLAERVQRLSSSAPSSTTGDDSDSERLLMDHLQSVKPSEVMKMMNVLHDRWNNLNSVAKYGNQFLASCLLRRQEALLRAVEIQLAKLEWERDRLATESVGATVEELKMQLRANRRLENYLEFGETLACHMREIVILVPSETPDARDADFEGRVALLATRWTRLVEWVFTHYAQLENALLHWRHFQEEADLLDEWLEHLEVEAKEVEKKRTKEMEQKMRRNPSRTEEQVLREARQISEAVSDAVAACLSRYETRWVQLLASLDRRATSVREACGDSIDIQRAVESRVDALVSRWSQLTEPQLDLEDNTLNQNFRICLPIMQQSVQIREDGAPSDCTKRVADSSPNAVPEKRFSFEAGRISLIPTGYRAEFERKAEKLLIWLDSWIEALELAIMKAGNKEQPEYVNQENSQKSESPSVVIEKINKELPEAKEEMVDVNSLGERYRKDLSQAGENVEELDQLFEDIEERWGLLDQLYKKASVLIGDHVTSSRIVPTEEEPAQHPSPDKEPNSICDSADSFKQWLDAARLEATCQVNCEDGNKLDEIIANFTRIVQMQPKTAIVEQFLASLDKQNAAELRKAWQDVRGLISQRVPILQNLCENHDLFINQIERFEKLMSDMFDYLDSVAQAANSQSSAIEAQLGESIEALRDMEKMQPTLGHLGGIVSELQGFFNEAYIKKLNTRLKELNQTWNRVKELTNENIEFLRRKLEVKDSPNQSFDAKNSPDDQKSDSVTSYHSAVQEAPISVTSGLPQNERPNTVVRILDMEELQKWISKAKHRFAKYVSINSKEDIDSFAEFLEQLRKELDEKRPMVEAMRRGEARDTTGKSIPTKTMLLFAGHFADLESEYSAAQERLKSATYHLKDFNSLMVCEKHWLERVDSILRKSKKQAYIDVGDICDEIMALDNLKSEHSEDDFARLKKIVDLLSSEKIMSRKLSSEFETYAAGVTSALKQLIRCLDELKKLKQRTEEKQNRLVSYEDWLQDETKKIQQRMRDGDIATSNSKEFGDWCARTAEIDGAVANIRHEIDEKSSTELLEFAVPESLKEKLNSIQMDSVNFKRTLLLFTYPSDIQSSIARSREATRDHDVAAMNLEVVSLSSDHIDGLLKKTDDLVNKIHDTQDLIDHLQKTVSSDSPPSELRSILDELIDDLKDLFEKNVKIIDHVNRFREGLQELQPCAEQYSKIVDPLDQVMMNVEEVTDYLETADTNNSHVDMLQRVLKELDEVLGNEHREPKCSPGLTKSGQKSTVESLEELLQRIESSVTPIEGLNSTIADVRRVIDKAFAARNAFRVQISGIAAESNESSLTDATEIRLTPQPSSNDLESTLKPSMEGERSVFSDGTAQNILPVLYARSNQLTSEMVAFFQDLDNFNKYCVNLNRSGKSAGKTELTEPLLTTISQIEKKIEVFLHFYDKYFKLQCHYLESRLKDLLKAGKVLNPNDRGIVLKVQKLWDESKSDLTWQLEEISQLAKTLKEVQEAFLKYERFPTEGNRQICLAYITRLEGSYNWRLNQDRARLDKGQHAEIAQRLSASSRNTNFLSKLGPFRELLQQLVTQLNEIHGELQSCQSIPTHELASQIQSLDQYFILAQETASKATNILNRCKVDQPPESEIIGDAASENEFLASIFWLETVLETQKGRLNSYCNEFHLCRPYWQEYSNFWQSFVNEAVRQRRQAETLQLDRPPNEDQGNSEVNIGSARDYAVNLCSSALTLQRLGSKIVWKAQYGPIGQGLNADLYLNPVFDKRFSHRPLRLESTLQDDIEFINGTFKSLVGELQKLSKKYSLDGFLPPKLRIDASRTEEFQGITESDSLDDRNEFQETTFPQTQSQRLENIAITSFEACLNRLKEELTWLRETNLYIPVVDTPANYISRLDNDFWLPPGVPEPIRLCSNWVKTKSNELAKLDLALKTHEKRSGQLCATSEKLCITLHDLESQRQLHEAADELHACMEAARGMVDRRRTRLSDWLSTCTAIEAAILMDENGDVTDKGGQQTLPVWIATIRKRLEQSSSNLDSPIFTKELEQLRSEFSPTGSGTGQMLRTVERAFKKYLADVRSPPQSLQRNCVIPELDPEVLSSVETSLDEWRAVCRLLRIDNPDQSTPQQSISQTSQMSNSESDLKAAIKKLAVWLDTVAAYLNSTVACLGGNFDQNTVFAHIKNRSGGSSHLIRSLYPPVIQIQLQQHAIELEARKPQLDKLIIETQRLSEEPRSTDTKYTDQLSAMVEEVSQRWNETSVQVKARLDELEKMMSATDELKSLERELDMWLSRAESNLADAISNTQDVAERKRMIQEIIDRLPAGEIKFTTHQNKCEAILAMYSKEDTQKFREDREAIQMRWSQLVSGLREALEGTAQVNSDLIEIPITSQSKKPETDLQRIVRLRTFSTQQSGTFNSSDSILPVASKSLETSMIEAHGTGDINQTQSYSTLGRHAYDQGQISSDENHRMNQLSRSAEIRSRPYDSRSSQRLLHENWPLFLAQLRQMNDWLAHQDANFHQLQDTIGGDSENVSRLINSFSILEEEIRHQRFQVEELLERGKMFLQDQTTDNRYGFTMESEGDSDGSEYEPKQFDTDESGMSTKRIIRRIRRHLNYLEKHWMELNRSMLAYRQQLDRAFQKLTVFERVLDDAEGELKAAQKLLMSQDPSCHALDQTPQIIWDTCASVTHTIAGLDGQALCLSDDGTIISHVLISRLDSLKIGLERLRSLMNEEMNRSPSVNGTPSAASPPIGSDLQRNLRLPPQQLQNADRANSTTPVNDEEAVIPRPKSPSECWLQVFKTVSYPWERCLLPTGNQVPYYKNHATQETQWDHPVMTELLQKVDEYNAIRFQAYKAASKIRQLQMRLFFDQIPLNVATETFARHGLSLPLCSEGCDGRVMDVPQMVNCLTTLYCRLWDILVDQPGVSKITAASEASRVGASMEQPPLRFHDSESIEARSNVQQMSMQDSASNSDVKSRSKRTPTHRSAIKCMTSVLCASSNKHNRNDEDYEEDGETHHRRPLSISEDCRQISEATLPKPIPPVETQLSSAYSRLDKLQIQLRLPDGREFSLLECVDLALNLLLNSFDSGRNGTIRVLSFKVTVFLLIDASLDEKYQYLFSLVADRDNKINESRLWLLVYEIMQLPRQLGEAQSPSSNLDMEILMCFTKNFRKKGHGHRLGSIMNAPSVDGQVSSHGIPVEEGPFPSVGLDRFYEWMRLEPSIVAWLPAMHRLIMGEKLSHQVRCSVCQSYPIRGLRYRCLRCLNFDLCQNCFLTGRVEKSHKVTHPIQEYTSTLQRSDSLRDFSRMVRNRFKSKEKFRQSSLDSDSTSKSSSHMASKSAGFPASYDRPPRAVPIRQNSTDYRSATPSPSSRQQNRPTSLTETWKRTYPNAAPAAAVDGSISHIANRPRGVGSMDQEHELIAQYSHSLRRQKSLTPTGGLGSAIRPPLYYGTKDSTHSLATPWQYGSVMYDRSRPAEPAFYTMRPNHMRGSAALRASSQPPAHPGSAIFVRGPPVNSQTKYYRTPIGWTGPMIAGSAGSLDKVLINLEEENRFLRAEYDRLRMQSPAQNLRQMRSPSLQYPLSQPGLYHDQEKLNPYHGMLGNPYLLSNSQVNHPIGYGRNQADRMYSSNNGVLYGGSLGRGGGAAAYSAFLRGGSSGRIAFDPASQHYGPKPFPASVSLQAGSVTPTQESELAQETRLLRQHKTRLESRMQLLEDHNKALEDQLNRLRQYLNIPNTTTPPLPRPASFTPASLTTSLNAQPQPYSRRNGSVDLQSGNGYAGNQYPPVSNRTPLTSSVTPADSSQGQKRSSIMTGTGAP